MRIILVNFSFSFFFCFQYFTRITFEEQSYFQIPIVGDFNATLLRSSNAKLHPLAKAKMRKRIFPSRFFKFVVAKTPRYVFIHSVSSFLLGTRRKFPPLDGTLLTNPRVTWCTPPIPFSPWPPCRIDAPSFRGAGGSFSRKAERLTGT